MLIDKITKGFQTINTHPRTNWTRRPDTDFYMVEDGSALAEKVMQYCPYFEYITENGVLVDVLPTERPPEPAPDPAPEPSQAEQLRADVDYLAAMQGVML